MAAALRICSFGAGDPLDEVGPSKQAAYLRYYFADQGAVSVVEEPQYFDRDYLAEFQAFYSTSANEYGNRCKRLHFFRTSVTRATIESAAGGDSETLCALQAAYLGFVVVRPIATPFGRVVVGWYDDPHAATTPRVIRPARSYACHIAGFTLNVTGLAWQQQDSAVGGCATVALWTMLHSSAFDDSHAIPTTADITRFAHRTASLGSRVFPSHGLNRHQMLEAIKEAGLAPLVMDGDKTLTDGNRAFGRERFASSCAALLRSGYPVLIMGRFPNLPPPNKHAICAVGFREVAPPPPSPGNIELQDARIQRLYIHDDNIGPNARFDVTEDPGFVVLKRAPPKTPVAHAWPDPTYPYSPFVPDSIVTAVHDGLRTSPDALHDLGITFAKSFRKALLDLGQQLGVTLSSRFMKLPTYHDELGRRVAHAPAVRARAQLALCEHVEPMSLHLGVVRIGTGTGAHLDILVDTTDTDVRLRPFCHVVYNDGTGRLVAEMHRLGRVNWGPVVPAY